jgi:cytochrome c-type biogenesis protein CcmH
MRAVLQWVLASVWLWGACVAAQALGGHANEATSGAAVLQGVQATLPGVGVPAAAHVDAPMSTAVQARWDHIAAELRCLVCQNESLASSSAELAVDLRREVRNLIAQGQSDADIRQFLVSRYGDFVLYKPEVKPVTWLLWFGPFVLLLLALGMGFRLMRRTHAVPVSLTDSERERARQLLES